MPEAAAASFSLASPWSSQSLSEGSISTANQERSFGGAAAEALGVVAGAAAAAFGVVAGAAAADLGIVAGAGAGALEVVAGAGAGAKGEGEGEGE